MKLLFVIQGLQSGGAERVMSVLCNTFVQKDIEILLALTERNSNFAYKLDKRIKVVDLTNSQATNIFKRRLDGIFKLRQLYKIESPDVVISFITRTNICAILAGIGLHIPIIISERNDPTVDPKNLRTRKLRDFLYPISAGCVFQTQFAMNCFSEKIKTKSTVLINPVSSDIYKIKKLEKREKKIVTICRLNKQKNIPLLIKAFSNVFEKYPEYHLEIYGEGEEKENLLMYIEELGIEKRCHLMGYTNSPIEILAKAEIFALSSNYEGMPNALIEAMCSGCACIATDAPAYGARDLIIQNENGILVGIGNEKEFTKALDRVLSDQEFRKKIGENAKLIEKKVNTELITDKWLDFIKSKIEC